MAGTKRASTSGEKASPRSKRTKVEEATESKGSSSSKNGKKAEKKKLPDTKAFKASALPLHFNITHTPATTLGDDKKDSDGKDSGSLGHLVILPTEFSTGSYGWKGSKKLEVALEGGSGEKVFVQISINATVVGSKPTKGAAAAKPAKNAKKSAKDESSAAEENSDDSDDE